MICDWDWTTTVGAWRYYSHGGTIAAAMFPREMVQRYWGPRGLSLWTDEDRARIAQQFCEIDFPKRERHPGMPLTEEWRECWDFLDAWLNGGVVVTAECGGRRETVKCFESEGKFKSCDQYLSFMPCGYVPKEYIVNVTRERITRNFA